MDARERTLLNVATELLERRGELPRNVEPGDWAHLSCAVAAYGERVEWQNPNQLDEHGQNWMLDEESSEVMVRFR